LPFQPVSCICTDMLRPQHIPQKAPVMPLPLERCLAKTCTSPQGDVLPGRNVLDHACISGETARALAELYPQALREAFFAAGCLLPPALHDIGKVSPTFQKKLYAATGAVPPELENVPDPEIEKQWGGHAGTGQAALAACKPGKFLAEIVGRHHGRLTRHAKLSTDEALGGPAWHERRLEFLEAIKARFRDPWPRIASQVEADVLAGLTTVADWIGSGSLFDDPQADWREAIGRAVQDAGFTKMDIRPDLSFADIFGKVPYPAQERFYTACTGPGVYLLEAPMGHGKTEAALYAAYRMLREDAATGIYFALPTRLTSNKIHQRVEPFLHKILARTSPHKNALLLHGKAYLQTMEMGEEGAPGREWFNTLKRAILAPFGVGTLDQALLAVLPDVRHSFVRSFGLLGKVVILDEVHSYDAYTGRLLDSLVERLRKLHCTVIILSATLTRERRTTLLACAAKREDYPLISALTLAEPRLREIPVDPLPDSEVTLHVCTEEHSAFAEALERAAQGQQILWIENTVADAQAGYRQLAAQAFGNVRLGLLHSRFLQHDRARLENSWTSWYGKDGSERGACGRILVGTQVLEQSLDIDADFLVTRFCPMDMFLQRLGRLWRHTLRNRAQDARREAWLLAPPQTEPLRREDLDKSAKVYAPYILFRSLEILRPLTAVYLPGQIRPLIEAVYAEREESGLLAALKAELRKEVELLARHARLAQAELGQARNERIATRYSEIDSTPVLLIRKKPEVEKNGIRIHFADGSEGFFPRNIKAYDKPAWRRLALLLDANTLAVASYHAPDKGIPKGIQEYLQDYIWPGEDEAGATRIAVVTESGALRALDGSPASGTYSLEYTEHLGYVANKK